VERGAGNAPSVALILYEGMHNRERRAGFAFDQLDRAEQRRRIIEMGDIGQEAADLELGMNAGRHLAQDLDDVLVVDDHAAIRLLTVDRAYRLDFGRRPGKGRRRTEFDPLFVAADRFAGANLTQQYRDE